MMVKFIPIVPKLQADAMNSEFQVSDLLRTAKIVATNLDLKCALLWIDCEMHGYKNLKTEELPPYRRLRREPKAWNPYYGWQPIHFEDPEHTRSFFLAPLTQKFFNNNIGVLGAATGRDTQT